MEYNNYYSNQPGHPPPGMGNHQHGGVQMQQQPPPSGGQMMHSPMSSQNIRQPMPQGPPNHHPQMQQQQHLGHHQRQMSSPHQHPNYHSIQPPHPHGPHISHSGSPHVQQQHHNHQPPSAGPPSQQHHMHPQSPHHHIGPPTHIPHQQQQLNQIVRPPLGPSYMNHPQPGMQQPTIHHHNFFGGSGGGASGPIQQSSIHHYPQQNQIHNPQQQPQHHHHHQHQSTVMHHHHPPTPVSNAHMQPGFGRNSPYYQTMLQTELRVMELCRRLQLRPPRVPVSPLPNQSYDDSFWWERFASEFFDDDATLTIRVIEDKEIVFTIGRILIPRFFRTYFDGGVTDLSINLRNSREILLQNNVIVLECDQAFIVTSNIWKNSHPGAIVQTEGHLSLEFLGNNFDNLVIKSWKFFTKGHREYLERSVLSNVGIQNALGEPVTRFGLTKATISYLKMCMIIEPMQELMSQHKQTNLSPRECLRRYLAEKFKFRSEDNRTATNKRKKRKPSAAPITGAPTNNKRSKVNVSNTASNNSGLNNVMMSPSGSSFALASHDVMVVGEPSMMGGDFGDDNERMITRLENAQYEPSASTPSHPEESNSMTLVGGSESNGLSNNNNDDIDTDLDSHTLSPSLMHQRQQQQTPRPSQQDLSQTTSALESISQQVEQSPTQNILHRQQINQQGQEVAQEEQSNNPTNLIENTDVQQQQQQPRDDVSQEEQKPVITTCDDISIEQVITDEHERTTESNIRLNEPDDAKLHVINEGVSDGHLEQATVDSVEQLENHTNSIQPLNEESNSNSHLACPSAPAATAIEQQQPVDNGVA